MGIKEQGQVWIQVIIVYSNFDSAAQISSLGNNSNWPIAIKLHLSCNQSP